METSAARRGGVTREGRLAVLADQMYLYVLDTQDRLLVRRNSSVRRHHFGKFHREFVLRDQLNTPRCPQSCPHTQVAAQVVGPSLAPLPIRAKRRF